MNAPILLTIAALAGSIVIPSATAREPYDTNALIIAAEQVLDRDADSLATIRVVSKNRLAGLGIQLGNTDEDEKEAVGTVIDAAGHIVIPRSALESPMGQFNFSIAMDGENQKIESKSEISTITAELADGREFDVEIAIEDPDLDIAILRPAEKLEEEATSIDLSDAAGIKKLSAFDPVIVTGRLSENLNRQAIANPQMVAAVVEKGRRLVVVQSGTRGVPVYNSKGKLLGILAAAPAPKKEASGLGSMMAVAVGMAETVIVPAAAVAELAGKAGEE